MTYQQERNRNGLTSETWKRIGGLHPRPFGSIHCEAGYCWGRKRNLATDTVILPNDGGMWRLCEQHAAWVRADIEVPA